MGVALFGHGKMVKKQGSGTKRSAIWSQSLPHIFIRTLSR